MNDLVMEVDLSGGKCSRCGSRHRTYRTQIKCYYPNAYEVNLRGERLGWVVARIVTYFDRRRNTDTFYVYLDIFDAMYEALEAGEQAERDLHFPQKLNTQIRVVPFGRFIPGASRWDDAPSRKRF